MASATTREGYGTGACPWLDAGGGDVDETDGSIGGSGQAGRKGSP